MLPISTVSLKKESPILRCALTLAFVFVSKSGHILAGFFRKVLGFHSRGKTALLVYQIMAKCRSSLA